MILNTVSFDEVVGIDMTANNALQETDTVVKEVFDLATRHQAKKKEGSRRKAYEKSLQEVSQIAGDDEMEALKERIIEYIQRKKKFLSGRETRKQGAQIRRNSEYSIPTGSWLGAD